MFLRKGISIPINTLVMLAIAIIVLLATVAWFMGAFAPTATQQKLRSDFRNSCTSSGWVNVNCEKGYDTDNDGDGVPDSVCGYYNRMVNSDSTLPATATGCTYETVAIACGCTPPFGIGRVTTTTTTIATTTTTVALGSTTTTVACGEPGDPCSASLPCCDGLICNSGICEEPSE